MLLENHGAVAWSADPYQAFLRLDTVEHYARVTLVAELLGGARALPRAEIAKLFDARARYGVPSPKGFALGAPLAAEDQLAEGGHETIDEALKVRGAY